MPTGLFGVNFSLIHCFSSNKSNTRDIVSSAYPNIEKREIRGICIANETLSRVFDISFQSNQNLRRKRRTKIVKIYAT